MSIRSKREALKSEGEREQAVLRLPGPRESIPRAKAFRSTWIVSSLESLRAAGLFDRYFQSLHEYRDEILSYVAGVWVPLPVVTAHYCACDALGLSKERIVDLSRGGGSHVRQNWHAAVLASARKQDIPTWTSLSKIDAIWRRSADGGAAAVFRLGNATARVEYVGCELFAIPYFRFAVRAALVNYVQHFGERQTVQILRQPTRDECDYLVEWE